MVDDPTNSGSAYVFTRVTAGDLASGWTKVAKLTAGTDGAANDYFGYSVSIDGDTVVIGAYTDDDPTNSGSAYVFTRVTAGDLASGWTKVAKLTAGTDAAAHGYFGYSVSIDGDTVVIGAYPYWDDDIGSAYVFRRDTPGNLGSSWSHVVKLTAGDGAVGNRFGYSVSIDGDMMVIGAQGDDDKGPSSGSAYMFTRDTPGDPASDWTQVEPKLTAVNDGAADDRFGTSVSISGDTMVVGAHYDDDKGLNSGSAYVFSKYVPPCDASSPPANGTLGDCTSVLESGSTCQPTCDQGYAVSGPSVCENSVLSPAVCIPSCDASTPPANGAVGNCTDQLLGDTTCQPTCDDGYIVSGKSSCDAAGALTAAVCRELSCCEQTFTKFGFGVAYSYGDEL
jgi:hypothetical protein